MAALIRKCEKIILTSDKELFSEETTLPHILASFIDGKYEVILKSNSVANEIFDQQREPGDGGASDLEGFIKQNLDQLLTQQCEDPHMRDMSILAVASACLNIFVQNNWLGPPSTKNPLQLLPNELHKTSEQEAFRELGMDGETVYTQSRFIIFLYIAKIILLDYRNHFSDLQTWDWWLMRCLVLQQTLLSDKSPTLKATVMELIDDIAKREPLMTDDENRDIQVLFHVEAGHCCHTYYEYKKAEEHFETARKISGIQLELTGAMGKRTRFQQDNKAQLILAVKREGEDDTTIVTAGEATERQLPKILPLDDETVLDEVAYVDVNVNTAANITQYEQVLILGLMESYRRSRAVERLTTEEILTYLAYILKNATNWSVAAYALSLRSKLERDSRRRVERSMMQYEELSNKANKVDTVPSISCRIPLFYAVIVPPVWIVQKELASLLLSLGLTGEALDVFEKLEMWEEAIACYQKMGKREKAETVIRQRLAVEETPTLLCYLGDVTRGLEHYQRAWELSKHRSARAMRSMAYVYFQEKNFEKAVECFAASLEINSLQIPVWFSYGCAALACQKFEIAAKGFRRCVSIEYDNFEAWANLANCYVKLKEKHKAFATLQDALKCNYENWRLWENSLIIGTDCGEFEDAIRSYHRLMDLKEKYADAEILGILSRAVVEGIPDARGVSAQRLWDKLTQLFGRVTAIITTDADIWTSYAKLYSHQIGNRTPDVEKAIGFQQRALKCLSQKADWEKDVELCKKMAEKTVAVVESQLKSCDRKSPQEVLQILQPSRLTLRGTLVKIQKQHTDPITQELAAEVTELCSNLETSLNSLVENIEAAKASR